MNETINQQEGVVEEATPQFTEKEQAIAKMRYYGQQSGKGFRPNNTKGSNRGVKLTKNDQKRIGKAYEKYVDYYFELSLDDLEAMIEDNIAYKIVEDKKVKLTGTELEAFANSYNFKLREKIHKEEEEKEKREEEENSKKEEKSEDIPQITVDPK